MSIVVYFLFTANGEPFCEHFANDELSLALKRTEDLRRCGNKHVCISSELDGNVGKPGVAAVQDGKTPDGEDYDWSKAGRAGKMKRNDASKPVTAIRNDH